jgi:phosphoserine phosphatase
VGLSCRFASAVFDVDSTLAGIEGIDWLAARRGDAVAARVRALTRDAMDGRVRLEDVYAARLEMIAPTRDDIVGLGDAYLAAVAPGARDLLAALRDAGVALAVVSGGIRQALLPLTRFLGVDDASVLAVPLRFDAEGRFTSVEASPLTGHGGKRAALEAVSMERPVVAVGDGATDLELRRVVDAFVAFTGFARRPAVARLADREFRDFPSLAAWLLG